METTHVTYVEIVEHSYIYIHTDRQTYIHTPDESCDAQGKSNNIQENVLSLVYISLKRIYFI